MKTISTTELEKIKTDLSWLIGKIGSHFQQQYLKGNDEEFKRLWTLYENYRIKLLELDEDIFSTLRKLELSKPDSDNEYYQEWGGLFSLEKDLLPLSDEVFKANQYLNIYERNLPKAEIKIDINSNLKLIARRFLSISRQLLDRYDNRRTIEIDDEYDVQDLFHALLKLYFDDIRKEEWTPSYAGGSSRMDFLLKNENTVVEIKKSRKGLNAKIIGEQLIVDIAKYKSHPNCKTLFCFIYDSEGKIANPTGIENDLTRVHDSLNVVVVIEPK
jgi:hypothetical protein